MTYDQFLALVATIRFTAWPLYWDYRCARLDDEHWTLRVCLGYRDADTGKYATGLGREWLITPDMTRDAVIKTAFAATKAVLEHESLEGFMVGGRRPFDPHQLAVPSRNEDAGV